MRCFGDRIMRPAPRTAFIKKLVDICQKEFLCNQRYQDTYIDMLVLGNYHVREAKAHVKMTNLFMNPPGLKGSYRASAVRVIQDNTAKFTGN